MEKGKPRSKKIRYLRLEDEDLVLPQIGLDNKSVEVNLVAYQPSVLLPKLKPEGKEFFGLINEDDVDKVKEFLNKQKLFNINCQNYAGATGLTKAVSNGNLDMVNALLEQPEIIIGDSVLHAVDKGNCAVISTVLNTLTKNGKDERACCFTESPDYSPDLTPMMLAAINENYEVIRLLLSRGHFVEKPHASDCFCQEQCWVKKKGERLRETLKRLNTYRALASPAYICQSASDPILTTFELSKLFYDISKIERELADEYMQLSDACKTFAVDLLAMTRTSDEVLLLLKRKQGSRRRRPVLFTRLATAVDYEQKDFVAHPHCQQVLRQAWLRDWSDWKSLSNIEKAVRVVPRILFLPLIALLYLCLPKSKFAQSFSSPINKFMSMTASYLAFLIILFIQNYLDSIDHQRGPPHTGLEWIIVIYVFGLFWAELKRMWFYGCGGYFESKWNIYNSFMVAMFFATFVTWFWAYYDIIQNGNITLERRFWDAFDPTLISEGIYSIATILAFGHILYIFQVNNNIGPLEVSISRMFKDIALFMGIFIIILFSFAMGIHKLYQYYIDQLYLNVHGIKIAQIHHFETFPHTMQTLFWSMFGMSPVESANVVLSPIGGNRTHPILNTHDFTQGVGHFLFATYHVVVIIILINMLIAMMANTFQKVTDNADVEWKYARTRVWLSYFEEGGTLPPPFNLIPSPKTFVRLYWWLILTMRNDAKAKFSSRRCCYLEDEDEVDTEGEYQIMMARLVQRYLRTKEKEAEKKPPTMADLEELENEIKDLKFATALQAYVEEV